MKSDKSLRSGVELLRLQPGNAGGTAQSRQILLRVNTQSCLSAWVIKLPHCVLKQVDTT